MALANGRKEFAISVTHSTEKHGHQKPILKKRLMDRLVKAFQLALTRLKH